MTLALSASACTPPAAPRADDTAPAAAVGQRSTSQSVFAELNALSRQANGLRTPLARYQFYRDRYQRAGGALRNFTAQVLAATASELGAYDEALRLYPDGAPTLRTTPAPLPDASRYRAVDAADGVTELAHDRRIVMVNEAHHAAQTRVLTLALLPKLRALGFTHFAAEGLSESDRQLATRGYPTKDSGPYVDEPLYGEIVRTALRLGFAVVAYESAAQDANAREEQQAQYLVERVFRKQPDARLFVHAGYAHVHKRAGYLDAEPMALRLARKAGIEPLVIDQTLLRPAAPGQEYADYRALLARFAIAQPTLLLANEGRVAWSLEPGLYDASVVLPPARLVNGRPDWLALGGERAAVAVGLDLGPSSLPCILEARYAGESDDAVPADRVLIARASTNAVLYLRPGDYRVAAQTAGGRLFGAQRLHVEKSE